MLTALLERPDVRFATAVIIGLLVGAEREQRHQDAGGEDRPGIRTFALVAILGAAAAFSGEPIVVGALALAVAAGAVARYAKNGTADAGLTTEIALFVTYALGALATRMPQLALAAGITAAVLLAFRAQLHGAVRQTLSPTELRNALVVAAAALVVLPMLPDEPLDPWHAVNPFVLWRLVVVAMGITVAARALERFVGARWGPALAGLASGFVSSSATVAAMGQKAKSDPDTAEAALMTATGSTVATFLQMAVLVGTASPDLFRTLVPALAAGALASGGYCAWTVLRAAPKERVEGMPERSVSLRGALLFAGLVGGVTLISSAVGAELGPRGALVTSAVAALADAHAAAAAAASLHAGGALGDAETAIAVLLCLSTNTVTKAVMAFVTGPRGYAVTVVIGLVLVLGVAWGAWAIVHTTFGPGGW